MKTVEKPAMEINEQQVEQFAGQVIADMSAGMSGVMIYVGHKLGLYKAMVGSGPLTSGELAAKTGTFERYVREWLNNQAAGGYLHYDPVNKTYEMSMEHALVLGVEDSPAFLTPGFDVVSSMWFDKDKLMEAFKSKKGIGWHEHHHHLFNGTESFFKTGYKNYLTGSWIPALEGIEVRLMEGGRVADIGCGHGASTIIMAKKYPNTEFVGFDYHEASVKVANLRAEEAGLSNVHFAVASADSFFGENFDLICFMDAFHDLGNPLQAVKHARSKLAPHGSVMLVEPAASDKVEENFNPLGRLFYAASTAVCVPHSHSQEGAYCLGAQAGPAIVEEIINEAGFTRFKIASRTPVNYIYEVKC